jgi:glycosyltransferase involved in cell wall biosynthesis
MTEAEGEGRPLHVLHIITGLADGGAEAALFRLITADRRDSHVVIVLMGGGKYGSLLSDAGIMVHPLNMPRGRVTASGLRQLWQLMRASNADVVQTWMYHADLVGGMVARLAGRRALVWGIRNTYLDPRTTPFTTRLVARMCAWGSKFWPSRIVSCSSRGADTHVRLGYDRRKIVVIPNGYDVVHLAPDPAARLRLRAEWAIGPHTTLLGMIASWVPQKDHQTLIGALAALGAGAGWHCMLVGAGMVESNAELRALLAQSGIGEWVTLLGPRGDVPAVMNALDLHVLSSASEGFPNVVAEAMACGTPCVVTDVGDAALIVGATGWVVPPGNPARLAAAITTAAGEISDPAKWNQRQRAARERIIERFGLDRMVQSYRKIWHAAESSCHTVPGGASHRAREGCR